MQWITRWARVGVAAALWGCTASHDVEGVGVAIVPGSPTVSATTSSSCKKQIEDSLDGLPDNLECTGLYTGKLSAKKLASNVVYFEPAHPLWSDGAAKKRWIFLPPGKTIDASNPDAWVFPVGTKTWKEFAVNGKRVETRIYEKTDPTTWAHATYEWNEDETAAKRGGAHDFMVDDVPYHTPSGQECEDCHNGRKDRLLGFEQVSLGLPRDEQSDRDRGLTLADLVAQKKITKLQGGTSYTIGDDGTGVAPQVFGWMHINCGVSCHNDNQNSKAFGRGMRLRLDPLQLDGRSSNDFDIAATTIAQTATTLRWNGQTRVVPGAPEQSLLYTLINKRGNKDQQMPPIASRLVDEPNTELVKQWIASLGASADQPGPD